MTSKSLLPAEIINKHLEAVGGKQALARLKSRVAIGTVRKENEPEVRMAIVSESPNAFRQFMFFERFDWHLTFDGKKSFVRGGHHFRVTSLRSRTNTTRCSRPA